MTQKGSKTLIRTLTVVALAGVAVAVVVLVIVPRARQVKREALLEQERSIEIAELGWKWKIRDYMKTRGEEDIRIIGWKAEKVGEQLYMVSYTFDDGSGEKGWFMEVNVAGAAALNIFAVPERMERYGISKVDEHIGKRSAGSP